MTALVLLGLVMLATTGCDKLFWSSSGCQCEDFACQRLWVDTVSASEPESWLTWNSRPMRLAGAACSTPADGACCADLSTASIESLPDGPPPEIRSQLIGLLCLLGASSFGIGLDLRDVRPLDIGSYGLLARGHTVTDGKTSSDQHWGGTLHVEQAVGTEAPFPDLVTDDFLRVMRLELSGGPSGFEVQAVLRFVLSASHFHGLEEAVCEDCGC